MRRRAVIALLAGAATWPLVTQAQQLGPKRVGVLMTYAPDDPEAQLRARTIEGKLRELGWVSGGNIVLDYHWAGGSDRSVLRSHAAGLVRAAPDLILCQSTPALVALREETKAIPLLFVQVTDPVGAGFVQSLAKPGGLITGFTDFEYDIGGKWVDLLKELDPNIASIDVIAMAGHAGNAGIFRAMGKAAASAGVRLSKKDLRDDDAIERHIAPSADRTGLIVLPSPLVIAHRQEILDLAARRQVPAIYPLRYFAASGGLLSYGIDQVDQWSRAATYVDRILKGEKPGDLPVQQPSKFELVLNLRTARAMGLDLPASLLARADEVIE